MFWGGYRPRKQRFQPRETFGEAFARGAGAGLGQSLTQLPFEIGGEAIKEQFPGAVERRKQLAAQRAVDEMTLAQGPERFEMEKGKFATEQDLSAARTRGLQFDAPYSVEAPTPGHDPEVASALAGADAALSVNRSTATPGPMSTGLNRANIERRRVSLMGPVESQWAEKYVAPSESKQFAPHYPRDEAAQDRDRAQAERDRRWAAGGGRGVRAPRTMTSAQASKLQADAYAVGDYDAANKYGELVRTLALQESPAASGIFDPQHPPAGTTEDIPGTGAPELPPPEYGVTGIGRGPAAAQTAADRQAANRARLAALKQRAVSDADRTALDVLRLKADLGIDVDADLTRLESGRGGGNAGTKKKF